MWQLPSYVEAADPHYISMMSEWKPPKWLTKHVDHLCSWSNLVSFDFHMKIIFYHLNRLKIPKMVGIYSLKFDIQNVIFIIFNEN